MKPLKSLKPSMREKKRYLLVKGRNLKENIEKSILDFIGILGMSKAGLEWVKKDAVNNTDSAIIAVNRKSLEHVRASFAVFPEKIEIKKVSGTLRGLGK